MPLGDKFLAKHLAGFEPTERHRRAMARNYDRPRYPPRDLVSPQYLHNKHHLLEDQREWNMMVHAPPPFPYGEIPLVPHGHHRGHGHNQYHGAHLGCNRWSDSKVKAYRDTHAGELTNFIRSTAKNQWHPGFEAENRIMSRDVPWLRNVIQMFLDDIPRQAHSRSHHLPPNRHNRFRAELHGPHVLPPRHYIEDQEVGFLHPEDFDDDLDFDFDDGRSTTRDSSRGGTYSSSHSLDGPPYTRYPPAYGYGNHHGGSPHSYARMRDSDRPYQSRHADGYH